MEEHWYLFSFCHGTEAAGVVNHPLDSLCRRWNTFLPTPFTYYSWLVYTNSLLWICLNVMLLGHN